MAYQHYTAGIQCSFLPQQKTMGRCQSYLLSDLPPNSGLFFVLPSELHPLKITTKQEELVRQMVSNCCTNCCQTYVFHEKSQKETVKRILKIAGQTPV